MRDCFTRYEINEIPYKRFQVQIKPGSLYNPAGLIIARNIHAYAHCYPVGPSSDSNAKDWIEIRSEGPAIDQMPSQTWIRKTEKKQGCRIFRLGSVMPRALDRLMGEYRMGLLDKRSFYTPLEESYLFMESRERLIKLEEDFLRFVMESCIWPGFYQAYRLARAIVNGETDISFSPYSFDMSASFAEICKSWEFKAFSDRFRPEKKEFLEISGRIFPTNPPLDDAGSAVRDSCSVYASFEEAEPSRLFIAESGTKDRMLIDAEELLPDSANEIFSCYMTDVRELDKALLSPLEARVQDRLRFQPHMIREIEQQLWDARRDTFMRKYADVLSAAWDEKAKARLDPGYEPTRISIWDWFGMEDGDNG